MLAQLTIGLLRVVRAAWRFGAAFGVMRGEDLGLFREHIGHRGAEHHCASLLSVAIAFAKLVMLVISDWWHDEYCTCTGVHVLYVHVLVIVPWFSIGQRSPDGPL